MKTIRSTSPDLSSPLPRRDLLAIFAYVDRSCRGSQKCVDGSFGAEVHLDRLAAAARMQ